MIVDANPIVTACLGRSQYLFDSLIAEGEDLYVPEHQMREAWLITAREGRARGRDPDQIFSWTSRALMTIPAETYLAFEEEARGRLGSGGQRDWPLVALALASGDAIWTNDVDLFGIGIAVWNTHNIRRGRPTVPTPSINSGK